MRASAAPTMHVAYLVNQYPKVSHTFIRREILALEGLGTRVDRFALRGWDGEVADATDAAERERTHYLLRPGLTGFWQISDRNETSFAARAAYDTQYCRRVSLWTDLLVLLATVWVVLRGTGY